MYWNIVQSTISGMTRLHKCGYTHNANFYFDMKNKSFNIKEPHTGKVYSVPLTEKVVT